MKDQMIGHNVAILTPEMGRKQVGWMEEQRLIYKIRNEDHIWELIKTLQVKC
jgi:hypothetical protein